MSEISSPDTFMISRCFILRRMVWFKQAILKDVQYSSFKKSSCCDYELYVVLRFVCWHYRNVESSKIFANLLWETKDGFLCLLGQDSREQTEKGWPEIRERDQRKTFQTCIERGSLWARWRYVSLTSSLLLMEVLCFFLSSLSSEYTASLSFSELMADCEFVCHVSWGRWLRENLIAGQQVKCKNPIQVNMCVYLSYPNVIFKR